MLPLKSGAAAELLCRMATSVVVGCGSRPSKYPTMWYVPLPGAVQRTTLFWPPDPGCIPILPDGVKFVACCTVVVVWLCQISGSAPDHHRSIPAALRKCCVYGVNAPPRVGSDP